MGERADNLKKRAENKSDAHMKFELDLQHKNHHSYHDFPYLKDRQLLEIAYGIRNSANLVCTGESRYSEQEMAGRTGMENRPVVPKGLSIRIRHLKAEMRRRNMDEQVKNIFGDWLRSFD